MTRAVPRRLDKGDQQFGSWVGKLRVEVDGIDVTDTCIGYDLEAQTAEVFVRGQDGDPLHNRKKLLSATVTGKVEVMAR